LDARVIDALPGGTSNGPGHDIAKDTGPDLKAIVVQKSAVDVDPRMTSGFLTG
jgi:hypothetical protein